MPREPHLGPVKVELALRHVDEVIKSLEPRWHVLSDLIDKEYVIVGRFTNPGLSRLEILRLKRAIWFSDGFHGRGVRLEITDLRRPMEGLRTEIVWCGEGRRLVVGGVAFWLRYAVDVGAACVPAVTISTPDGETFLLSDEARIFPGVPVKEMPWVPLQKRSNAKWVTQNPEIGLLTPHNAFNRKWSASSTSWDTGTNNSAKASMEDVFSLPENWSAQSSKSALPTIWEEEERPATLEELKRESRRTSSASASRDYVSMSRWERGKRRSSFRTMLGFKEAPEVEAGLRAERMRLWSRWFT